ncbi:hypothetical protein ACH44C_00910 [Streptomyces purpureus]|uniref:hypothetical protein n=1 Tax=Streptomyces purpureus TaxID=1951 RepID=UPI0003A6FA77|nr:hypothetical protein [Streptomyces purpureus]
MITKRTAYVALLSLALLAGTAGCGSDTGGPDAKPAPPGGPAPTSSRPSGPSDAPSADAPSAAASPSAAPSAAPDDLAKPADNPRAAARNFARALASGDAGLACGLASPTLRARVPGGPCPEALSELATDSRYVFTQKSCVEELRNYEISTDAQDTPGTARVNIHCPQGYTWVRAEQYGTIWRVIELNAP